MFKYTSPGLELVVDWSMQITQLLAKVWESGNNKTVKETHIALFIFLVELVCVVTDGESSSMLRITATGKSLSCEVSGDDDVLQTYDCAL